MEPVFDEIIKRSPKVDLDEFLKHFNGCVLQGRKGFRKAAEYIRQGRECVVIFHSWWVVLRNGADWMHCLKLTEYMNDWKGEGNGEILIN